MHATEFARCMARIERQIRGQRRVTAMRALRKRAHARPVYSHGRVIAYRMPDGSIACVKQRFVCESSALAMLASIRRTATNSHIPVRAYLCEWCGGWHLTSKEN